MKSRIKTRDWSMVRLIQGATKAAVHSDQRKQASRDACRTGERMSTFKCVGCKTVMEKDEQSKTPGWCVECDAREIEACKRDEENDRDGWDEDEWEDPAVTYQRERGEAWEDRYQQWRREY